MTEQSRVATVPFDAARYLADSAAIAEHLDAMPSRRATPTRCFAGAGRATAGEPGAPILSLHSRSSAAGRMTGSPERLGIFRTC